MIVFSPIEKERVDFAEFWQAAMREIGVNVDILRVDLARWRELRAAKDWDIQMGAGEPGWVDPSGVRIYWDSRQLPPEWGGSGFNYQCYNNPTIDKLFDDIDNAPTMEARIPLYKQLHKFLNEEVPNVPLYLIKQVQGVSNRVQNYQWNPTGSGGPVAPRFLNIHEWWLAY